MKKNSFKFEISFNINTQKGEKVDKHSVKQFERSLYDFVNNYAKEYGSFYVYGKDYDEEALPNKIKVKKVAAS